MASDSFFFDPDDANSCACGLTGPNCTQAVPEVTNPMEDVCENVRVCFFDGEDSETSCICDCGWSGDLCDERLIPRNGSFALGLAFGFLFIILSVLAFLIRKESSLPFSISMKDFSGSYLVQESKLLTFRVFCAVLGYTVLILYLADFGFFVLRAFTIWNWVLFTLFFTLMALFSLQDLRRSEKGAENVSSDKLSFVRKFALALLEIELGSSLLIMVIVWVVLYPVSVGNGTEDNLINVRGFIVHGINFCLLCVELVLDKLHVRAAHVWFILAWGGMYVTFHVLYMMVQFFLLDEDHCPVYGFLSQATPFFPVWLAALALMLLLFFLLSVLISRTKEKYITRKAKA